MKQTLLSQHNGFWQGVLILATVAFSWLAMQVVHEGGHILHLLAAGGSVERLTLHPLAISHTLPAANPCPLVTVAGGPIWGVLLPLVLWWQVARWIPSRAYLAAFFLGFCLVSNGAYLAGDAVVQGGDGRELVLHGVPAWTLVAAGLCLVAAGLYVWHGLGGHFGLGRSAQPVRATDALAMAALLGLVVLAELIWR